MARDNAFSTATAIALVSDYGRAFNLPANATAYWVNELETKGFDATLPRLIHSLYQGVATANVRAAKAEADATRLGQTLVGWDANDMAISAAAAVVAPAHVARAPYTTATPVNRVQDVTVGFTEDVIRRITTIATNHGWTIVEVSDAINAAVAKGCHSFACIGALYGFDNGWTFNVESTNKKTRDRSVAWSIMGPMLVK